jgi:hypothetical protein
LWRFPCPAAATEHYRWAAQKRIFAVEANPAFGKDDFPIWCEYCGQQGYIFIDNLNGSYFVVCKNCGWETSQVWCPKCEAGGSFVENIGKHPSYWICATCKTRYLLPENFYEDQVSLILEKELPDETRQRIRERNSLDPSISLKVILFGFIIAVLVLAITFIPVYLIDKTLAPLLGDFRCFIAMGWIPVPSIILLNKEVQKFIAKKSKNLRAQLGIDG